MPSLPNIIFTTILFTSGWLLPFSSARSAPATDMADTSTADTSTTQSLTTSSGEEISFEVYKTDSTNIALRIFWIAPGFGIDPRIRQTAEALAKQGIEVWLVDLADALFLTKGASSMREISGQLVADLIDALIHYNNDHAEVLIVSSSYGAIPSIRGIHAWQSRKTRQPGLLGAVLFSPSFLSHVPELGLAPSFIPELAATNAPLYIFQAENNGNRWHLPAVLKELTHAPVYVELLKGVTSVFHEKDTAALSVKSVEHAPNMIGRAIRQLRQHDMPLTPLPLPPIKTKSNRSGLNIQLRPYTGVVTPRPIRLHDVSGKLFDIKDYHGKVTIINFWASWCPPCVEEIPSLNRLTQAMQDKPFQLISINYAETAEKIRDFLTKVNVDFPVLLDPGGRLTGQWKVLAFPSTFVIGPDGNIQFGVNAGIHWDTDEVTQQLKALLPNRELLKPESPKPE